MNLTRDQAERVVKEAIAQGWADEGTTEHYPGYGKGRVDLHDFGPTPDAGGNHGCIVELAFPGMYSTDTYWIHSTEDWRKLKAKVDELRQIVQEVAERGWHFGIGGPTPKRVGKFGMYIEVVPPGGSRVYPVRVGGMRTWRKLCREFDQAIDAPVIHGELSSGETA